MDINSGFFPYADHVEALIFLQLFRKNVCGNKLYYCKLETKQCQSMINCLLFFIAHQEYQDMYSIILSVS